jgi:four helix bundle protein
VVAKDFTELVAWQLASELEEFVVGVTCRPLVARDLDYCRQANDAAASAPRNIAEGFGRFSPNEFAHFLRIAIGSEFETRNHILKAAARGYVTTTERDAGLLLTRRALSASIKLRRYLRSPKGRANAARIDGA